MGDTNIKKGKSTAAFRTLLENQYKNQFSDDRSDVNLSSLGTKPNNYSEPYDKLFSKTNLNVSNPYIYHLGNIYSDGTLSHLGVNDEESFLNYAKETTGVDENS
ncbi:UNVERIFIED_CONTAM: hypothetical protein O8I53_10525 [Campylobacter lari]